MITQQRTASNSTHCNTLQHTAKSYFVRQHTFFAQAPLLLLQHIATRCNALQHTASHCITRQHTATHCNTLQHTAKGYLAQHHTYRTRVPLLLLQYSPINSNTLPHTATHCNTLQHTATHGNILQRNASSYFARHHGSCARAQLLLPPPRPHAVHSQFIICAFTIHYSCLHHS